MRGAPEPQHGPVVVRPMGRRALLLELESAERVAAWHAELLRRREAGRLPAGLEIVPAAGTVLLDGLDDPAALAAELPGWRVPAVAAGEGPLVEVPVVYDGADLAAVAGLWGVTEAEAVRLHCAPEYRVAFCGFAPGFGYLTGLPERLSVPRLATPRTRVPAGSVAVAGSYTGVYPQPSPGGWRLLGRTGLRLWDPARQPAALLAPGVRVRFVPVPPPAGRPGEAEPSRAPDDTEGRG
ncbi:5-oxoprolinase subunit B family protein [Peterkaempfera griseoplana]|uniref:5-oxoprolinase subunit B family protein n=1 Tax=Peterkaempfera griseoplana TaxID=66896 RepID=UPI0006E14B45|nr:allophanate hydrolase subunit 1 [Peterkaempfera griseoplana]